MTKVEFEDFEFRESDDKVKAIFMRYYHFFIDKEYLGKIGKFTVHKDFIEFDAPEKAVNNKFNIILSKGMSELVSILGKPVVYVHRDSGIPLLGVNEFGIIDRDTTIIEVKAHSLCNLDCIYCSVDAGRSSKKGTDFVVEEEYLVQEFEKIASIKKRPVEASINPQGEPLMYSRIFDLIRDLKAVRNVEIVSINTNGILLSKEMIDKLVKAGLDRINLSLNTINQETANKLAGSFYPLENVKKIIGYCDGKIEVLLAPIIVPSYNDEQIDELLEFVKTLKTTPKIGFQNFFEYKRGRNPVKGKPMESFMKMLEEKEKKYGLKLIHKAEDFNIIHDEKIPKPFRKNNLVEAIVVCSGKYPSTSIAVANDRCISLKGSFKTGSRVRLRLVRDKHNIFVGIKA